MKTLWFQLIARLPLGNPTLLFSKGKIKVLRGKVRSVQVTDLQLVASEQGITDGCIHIQKRNGQGEHLSFYGIPESVQQRIRNVWNVHSR